MKPFTKGLLLLTAIAIPSALAGLVLFGCCILPFHERLHSMPLCLLASQVLTGHHDGADHDRDGDHGATPPPSREKLSFGSPSFETSVAVRLFVGQDGVRRRLDEARSDPRNFISLGAVRCENDVGLHLLHTTFLI